LGHFRHRLATIALVAVTIIEVHRLDLVDHPLVVAITLAVAVAIAKLSLTSKVEHILKWVAIVILILLLQTD
tara:strand:- start:276 stop:491 length:216 start_codon:yes stop_codon:yes gene_type:complete